MKKNYGLKFRGEKDSGILIPYSPVLKPTNAITIEAWVYVDESVFSGHGNLIVSCTQSGGYALAISGDNKGKFYLSTSSGSDYLAVNFDEIYFKMNEYNHMAGSFDGRYLKIYLNGVLMNINDLGKTYTIYYNYQNALAIGNDVGAENNFDTSTSNYGFSSIIDEVRIWNYARSVEEIRQCMNKKLLGNESGLIGYWRLDEGEGTTVYDLTPNRNNGTIYNAEWVESTAPIYEFVYLLQNKDGNLSSIDNDTIIDLGNQTITEELYLNSGFSNLTLINNAKLESGEKLLDNAENYRLLMYTDNTNIKTATLNYNCEEYRPIDKCNDEFKILMYKEE